MEEAQSSYSKNQNNLKFIALYDRAKTGARGASDRSFSYVTSGGSAVRNNFLFFHLSENVFRS